MRTLITLTLAVLALPAAALAGGWATAGLAPPPAGLGAGETWQAELLLLQHGRAPLEGVQPTITISGPEERTFPFAPAGRPGTYVAHVVFPSAGSWVYSVDDGFSQVHAFKPVEIGGPAAAPGGSGFPLWVLAPLAAAALAALALLGLALARRRAGPEPLPE